jgi:fibro-slime domain-containing protein
VFTKGKSGNMKFIINLTARRRGVIALVTMLMVTAIAALSISMVINSQINQAAANNYRNKIQTYYAADGVMTMLAQEMLDFNDSCYLKNLLRPHLDIGTPGATGSLTINSIDSTMDTMKCGGRLSKGVSDAFHYSYIPLNGTISVYVKILALKYGNKKNTAKAGIMIRQDLSKAAKYVMVAYTDSGSHDSITLQSRKYSGDTSYRKTGIAGISAPQWLKINKSGKCFYVYYCTPGASSWTYLGSDTVDMVDPVYVGLATASGSSSFRDTAVFDSAVGLPIGICIDSVYVGGGASQDTIPVKYTLVQTAANIFSMYTEAYKNWGAGTAKKHSFVTRLNQSLGREAAGTWHATVHDSTFLPATFYDMRANLTNPEFNVNATLKNSSGKYVVAHFVNDTLNSDYKPVKKTSNATFRNNYMGLWSLSWYSLDTSARNSKINAVTDAQKLSCLVYDSTFSWNFNDSLHTWFRPYGDSTGKTGTYIFDRSTGRWSGLKKRPNWSGSDSEWVTEHWDSTSPFANIVMYDTLKFMERHITKGSLIDTVFVFGDTNNSRWFDSCYNCDGSTVTKFMPLHKKGFKYDCKNRYTPYSSPCDTACFYRANFGFTMEIHSTFTCKPGQFFAFRGDDDVWVFINNKLVIDLGGIHDKLADTVFIDSCGLVRGQKYNFDFFYCERNVTGSNILITTNMSIFLPPQPTKRSWTRDYGNFD